MECVARRSIDIVLHGGSTAMCWGNPGFTAKVGAGVIPKPSSGGVVTGVSVSVWNAKRHFLERPSVGPDP